MALVLFIWAEISGLYGAFAFTASRSALHEIEAGIAFLIATVAFVGSCIIDAIKEGQSKKAGAPDKEKSGLSEPFFSGPNVIR